MYLLNRAQILSAKKTDQLAIDLYEESQLSATAYYARLGATVWMQEDEPTNWYRYVLSDDEPLRIEARTCVRVESYESFGLGSSIFGILGSTSQMAKEGLGLLHGPTIDPRFPNVDESKPKRKCAPVEMALVNHSKDTIELRWPKQVIAKIAFFNVSDTYPIHADPNTPGKMFGG